MRPGGVTYYLGLGKEPGFAEIQLAFRSFVHRFKAQLPALLGVNLLPMSASHDARFIAEAAANGVLLGVYELGLYKTENPAPNAFSKDNYQIDLCVPAEERSATRDSVNRAIAVGKTQIRVMDLVNAPANKKTPQVLEDWAIASGKKYGYKVAAYDKKSIVALGLEALLAVNQGSELPPAFIIMEYVPTGESTGQTIGLVGKGVTFDTGGISIKGSSNMHFMKSDMGGAAAVLGAVEAAARLKLPLRVVGIIPATENCIGEKAVKPGDVIGSYAGKTIEVIDTDAEGRLILADGISYMVKNYRPDIVIDLATLTGSCVQTLGYAAGGLFTNNDDLCNTLQDAANYCGERVWRLPLWDAYAPDIKSDIADLKNYHGKPVAGAIVAAKFLEAFTDNHPAWAHLDIAGVAFADSEFSTMRAATAWGVRLLVETMERVVAGA